MLTVENLHVYYGMIQAIKGISFSVEKGEVVALIGSNGAGKTTTLHTVTGLLHPKQGKITFEGQDITKSPAHSIVKQGITHVPEGRHVSRICQSTRISSSVLSHSKTKNRSRRTSSMSTGVSRALKSARNSRRVRSRAANSRCSPWAAL